MKNKNGITLIALVVTIIIILILAGVSLSIVVGDNSVIEQATSATGKTKAAEIQDIIDLTVSNNRVAKYSKQGVKTKVIVVNELYEQGKITEEQKNRLSTSDTITINGTVIDFSKIDEKVTEIPKITTLAGTKWKMNDVLTDYDFFGIFDYEEQTGWEDLPSGCMISNETLTYEVHGFARSKFLNIDCFSTVQSWGTGTFTYSEGNEKIQNGWAIISEEVIYGVLVGQITTEEEALAGITYCNAPTITFSEETNNVLENQELINWFYNNGTIQ